MEQYLVEDEKPVNIFEDDEDEHEDNRRPRGRDRNMDSEDEFLDDLLNTGGEGRRRFGNTTTKKVTMQSERGGRRFGQAAQSSREMDGR
eukprot:12273586-Karenia_brevis.AAC.1